MKPVDTIFKKHFTIALLFFFLSGMYGWLLRLQKVIPLHSVKYDHFIQAHSHVTFLGWGFLGVVSLIYWLYFPKQQQTLVYKIIFCTMTLSLLGLLVSFPLQGYKLYSILFLTVFLLTSYIYLYKLLRILKDLQSISSQFIRSAIYYYYLSSLAIWAVAFITVQYGKTDMYHNAIYFYLHFLYNGFFVMVLFGLFISYLEKNTKITVFKDFKWFYRLTNFAIIPAYTLSLLWNPMPEYVVFIGFVAVIVQLISLLFLRKILYHFIKIIEYNTYIKLLFTIVFVAYFLKIILQFLSAFPQITQLAVRYKPFFVIGYIHLFTLGFMSAFIFLIIKIRTEYTLSSIGIYTFSIGVIFSELLLFSQGLSYYFSQYNIPYYTTLMLIVSTLMPLGLLLILTTNLKILLIQKT